MAAHDWCETESAVFRVHHLDDLYSRLRDLVAVELIE
jgi:hypothetical protein